jgi:hypothetical protein
MNQHHVEKPPLPQIEQKPTNDLNSSAQLESEDYKPKTKYHVTIKKAHKNNSVAS